MIIPSSIINLRGDVRMVDAVRAGLEHADEACFAVSFTRCSGLGLLVESLKEALGRQSKIKLLTSTYQTVTQPAALEALLKLDGLDCRVQAGPMGFHSKFWLFKNTQASECWAGSSNLSKGGLADNIEWNLRSSDPAVVSTTHKQFLTLWDRHDVHRLTHEFIDQYALTYDALQQTLVPLVAADSEPSLFVPNQAQTEALGQLATLRSQGIRRAAVIAATGVGKTYLAAFDVARSGAKSVLFISHRKEHLTQAKRTFDRVLTEVECEFLTVQSLRTRPEVVKRKWDYLVIDEFHHVEAPSYRPLRDVRDRAKFMLGLTATPERADGREILEWCDWNIAYEVRLPEAIERKWLLPFHYFGIADETIDFGNLQWRNGGFVAEELEEALSLPKRVELILTHAKIHGFDGPKRATVGFCAGLKHADYMAAQFKARGENAVALHGTDSVEAREATYARLADPRDPLEWIFVADILNEGVDVPAINSLMFLRPTESSTVFLQQLGRGLRLCEGTEVLTVLDFVGHHKNAWLTLQSLSDIRNTGARIDIGKFQLKPPSSCEVVLQKRTLEILAKIQRTVTKRERCEEAYQQMQLELKGERSPRPIDLMGRSDGLTLKDFWAAYKPEGGDWLACQTANKDAPAWAAKLDADHPARRLLRCAEKDHQQQRVTNYALLWGAAAQPDDPERGFIQFFEEFPQWLEERTQFDAGSLDRLRGIDKTNPDALDGVITKTGVAKSVVSVLGDDLLPQIQGRLLLTLNKDYETRHGGVLSTPDALKLHKFYRRPEIVRHFGRRFDPARHNSGVLDFGELGIAIITKLDTSGAVKQHQYENAILSPTEFSWTSQNKMEPKSGTGLEIVENKVDVRLFVQSGSHSEACFVGLVTATKTRGEKPMVVRFELEARLPAAILEELGVDDSQ